VSERPQHRAPRLLAAAGVAAALVLWLASCGPPGAGPAAVGAVTATPLPAGVLVEWTGGEGADAFVVYRAAAGEELAELARVPGDARRHADYTADPEAAYTYAVAPVGPSGPGEPVAQEGEPVTPLPGVRLRVHLDGPGSVAVAGPDGEAVCREDCVVGFAPGSEAELSGRDGDLPFAGFGAPCPPAPTCRLVLDEDVEVPALFRTHVLRLGLDGDAPARAVVSPPDDRGVDTCELRPGDACLLGYTYTAGGALLVSVNAGPLDPSRAQLVGLAGACEASQGFCVAAVEGAAAVAVLAAVTPVAAPDAFAVRADAPYTVPAPGVRANDDASGDARSELVGFAGPGELELAADGSFTYSPPERPPGSVTFSYRLRGAHDVAGPPAEVALTLVPAPRAAPDSYTTAEDTALRVPAPGVLANDSPGGEVAIELVSADGHGEVALAEDGSFEFRPARDDVRPFGFRYRLRNPLGAVSEEVGVTVNVTPVNDPPRFELSEEELTAEAGTPVELAGFVREVSPGGGPDEASQTVTFHVTRVPGGPAVFLRQPTIDQAGTLRFTPLLRGWAVFEVVARDSGNAVSEPRRFRITVP